LFSALALAALAKHPGTAKNRSSVVSVSTLSGTNQTIASEAGDFMAQFASCHRVDSDREKPGPRLQLPPLVYRNCPSSKFHRHKEQYTPDWKPSLPCL